MSCKIIEKVRKCISKNYNTQDNGLDMKKDIDQRVKHGDDLLQDGSETISKQKYDKTLTERVGTKTESINNSAHIPSDMPLDLKNQPIYPSKTDGKNEKLLPQTIDDRVDNIGAEIREPENNTMNLLDSSFQVWNMYKTLYSKLQKARTNNDIDKALNYLKTRLGKIELTSPEDCKALEQMLNDIEKARVTNGFKDREYSESFVPYNILMGKMDALKKYISNKEDFFKEQAEIDKAERLSNEASGIYARIEEIHKYIRDNLANPQTLHEVETDIEKTFSKVRMHYKRGGKPVQIKVAEMKSKLYNLRAWLALRKEDYALAKKEYTKSNNVYRNNLAEKQIAILQGFV